MKKVFSNIAAVLAGLFIVISIFGEVLSFCCLDEEFFISEYEKMDTAEQMGMSHEELMASTNVLLDYLKDKRDDIKIEVTVNGEKVQMFDERETLHMVDVKALYQKAILVPRILGLLGIAIMAAFLIKRDRAKRHRALRNYHVGNAVFLGIIAILGIYAIIDFSNFWTNFHLLFFDNDLWLLYPDERLIQMVPQQFFSDLVARIVGIFVVFMGVPAAVCAFFRWDTRDKEKDD